MYHVCLQIYSIDVPQSTLEIWQKIAPKARFSHEFHAISKIDQIRPLQDTHQRLVIINQTSKIPLSKLKESVADGGRIVLYCEDIMNLGASDLSVVDEIWQGKSEPLSQFYFTKTLQILADQKEAWQASAWLQATINSLPDMVWFKDIAGLHLEVNDAFCQIVDKPKNDVRGKDHYYIWNIPKEVYERSDYVCVQTEDDVIVARKTVLFDEEVMKADGNLSKLKTYKTPIFDGETIIGTVGIARDVTKEFEYLQNIEHLAHHDQLTGLANRNQLDKFLEKIQTHRMSIIYMDLDHFKAVNDNYGHQMGDRAIVMVAELIKEIFHDAMNVRIGGDEFISIFTDTSDISTMQTRLQILIDRFFKECQNINEFANLSISAGLAEGKLEHGSFDLLLQRADAALYRAKHSGRGKFYTSPRDNSDLK